MSVARERAGTQFGPDLVELFVDAAPGLFDELDAVDAWQAVLSATHASRYWLRDRNSTQRSRPWRTSSTSSPLTRSGTPGAWRPWRPLQPPRTVSASRTRRSSGGPAWFTISGGWGCPTASGTG